MNREVATGVVSDPSGEKKDGRERIFSTGPVELTPLHAPRGFAGTGGNRSGDHDGFLLDPSSSAETT